MTTGYGPSTNRPGTLARRLIRDWVQLVTLKYTQYGGEGYLRDGDKGVLSEGELLFPFLKGGQGRPPFLI